MSSIPQTNRTLASQLADWKGKPVARPVTPSPQPHPSAAPNPTQPTNGQNFSYFGRQVPALDQSFSNFGRILWPCGEEVGVRKFSWDARLAVRADDRIEATP